MGQAGERQHREGTWDGEGTPASTQATFSHWTANPRRYLLGGVNIWGESLGRKWKLPLTAKQQFKFEKHSSDL